MTPRLLLAGLLAVAAWLSPNVAAAQTGGVTPPNCQTREVCVREQSSMGPGGKKRPRCAEYRTVRSNCTRM